MDNLLMVYADVYRLKQAGIAQLTQKLAEAKNTISNMEKLVCLPKSCELLAEKDKELTEAMQALDVQNATIVDLGQELERVRGELTKEQEISESRRVILAGFANQNEDLIARTEAAERELEKYKNGCAYYCGTQPAGEVERLRAENANLKREIAQKLRLAEKLRHVTVTCTKDGGALCCPDAPMECGYCPHQKRVNHAEAIEGGEK